MLLVVGGNENVNKYKSAFGCEKRKEENYTQTEQKGKKVSFVLLGQKEP